MFVYLLELIVVHRSRPFDKPSIWQSYCTTIAALGLTMWSYHRSGCRSLSWMTTSRIRTFLSANGSVAVGVLCKRKAFVFEVDDFKIFQMIVQGSLSTLFMMLWWVLGLMFSFSILHAVKRHKVVAKRKRSL